MSLPAPPSRPAPPASPARLALPPLALSHIRRSLRREVGALAATHVLHDAGFAAGEDIFEHFADRLPEEPVHLPAPSFWSALSGHLEAEGWGHFEVERVHSGLGLVRAHGWAESNPEGEEEQPGCHFTSGMFAALLGRVAGGPVAVLEVLCRSKGDDHCGFLYGSEAAIHEIYGLLLDGASLDDALAGL